jgi:hypothetical protein
MKQLLLALLTVTIIASCGNANQTDTTPDTTANKMSTEVSKDTTMLKDTNAKNAGDTSGIIGNKNTATLTGDDSVSAGLRMKGLKDSSKNKKNKKSSKMADSSLHK